MAATALTPDIFNLAINSQIRQIGKFKLPPSFPIIRYLSDRVLRSVHNDDTVSNITHVRVIGEVPVVW